MAKIPKGYKKTKFLVPPPKGSFVPTPARFTKVKIPKAKLPKVKLPKAKIKVPDSGFWDDAEQFVFRKKRKR